MLLEGPFVLKPSPSQHNKVRIFYTGRDMPPRVKRRLMYVGGPPSQSAAAAVMSSRSSSLSSDGLPLIKRRRRVPPTPLHRDHVVEQSIAQAFVPPTQDYRKKAEFWQGISRKQKQQILNLEMDARQLRRRLWELEEQVVWWASSARGRTVNGEGRLDEEDEEGPAQPHSATSAAQPISPSTNHTEKPPLYIITQPRKCCFYLTDGEGLSEDDYDQDNDEECEHCCDEKEEEDDEEKEEATKENASSGGNNTGAAQLFRVKKESRDDDVVE